MVVEVSVRVLGTFQVQVNDQPVNGFESARVRALLTYLAMERDRQHPREALAALLWPEQPDHTGRENLRRAIANLRLVLGDRSADLPILLVTRDGVQINPAVGCRMDAAAFEALIEECNRHAHRHMHTCRQCVARLREASSLYQGDFLAHLGLADSEPFEEWAMLRREHFHRYALEALYQLAEHYLQWRDYVEALGYARQQLALEPWREEAHRQVMRAMAGEGQRSAALAQYERCRRVLAEEFGTEPAAETIELYGQIRGMAAPQLPAPVRNWPGTITRYIERVKEQQQIADRLETPAARLITLTGLGGAGKTRLALRVAELEAPVFRNGAAFVSLATLTDPDLILNAIASALDLRPGDRAVSEVELTASLRTQELLLVLDGAEQLAGYLGVLERLLRACPGLAILATSRQRLNIPGEWLFVVNGLSTSGGANSEAARLFLDHVQQIRSDQPGDDELAQVARICNLLDGLPLGIELAAAWTAIMTCAQIADELETGLGFLTSGPAASGEPRPGPEAILEQTWALLPAPERAVLRQLAATQDGFRSQEAAQVIRIWPGADVSEKVQGREYGVHELSSILRLLSDRALIHMGVNGRYRVHSLVSQFARTKLP